ncbi:MAG: hypothetical protein WD009_11495 [Phycisphaeraceae bacterium]
MPDERDNSLTRVERHFAEYAAEHAGTWWTRWAYVRAWVGAGLFAAAVVAVIAWRPHRALELAMYAGMLLLIEGMFTFLLQLCGKVYRGRHEGTEARGHEGADAGEG